MTAKSAAVAREIVGKYIRGRRPLETHADMVDEIEAAIDAEAARLVEASPARPEADVRREALKIGRAHV